MVREVIFSNFVLSMKIEFQITEDGSHTLFVPELDEHYHSVHGAIQESKHIFIDAGLQKCSKTEIRVLEVGFGTGLNAFLSALESEDNNINISYTALELYPISFPDAKKLNYSELLNPSKEKLFDAIHSAKWGKREQITTQFSILKHCIDFSIPNNFTTEEKFDVIYFDAFAPEKQPEMWTMPIFQKIYSLCAPDAILTTYCAKGSIRRMLQEVGFHVERLPGPPGKREILRATASYL